MPHFFDLSGRTALITGSVRGIGFSLAEGLGGAGATVIVNGRQQVAVDEAVAKLQAAGCTARGAVFDVADESAVIAAFDTFDHEGVEIDILINNAGNQFRKPMVELELKDWQRVIDTNLNAAFLVGREAAKRMIARGRGGKVIFTASLLTFQGGINVPGYAASKGAVDSLTTGLSLEVAAQGIRVNCVRPGLIYTDIHASGGEPGRVDRVKALLPMQRGGQPEEVAQAIVWLLSEKASYVTGSFIELAGGK